jgi:phosphate starvation-inducible protein PhoH and related proteins
MMIKHLNRASAVGCYARQYKEASMSSVLKELPKTPNHSRFCELLQDDATSLVIATGPAGVGKTFASTSYAIHKLASNQTKRVIITRPTVGLEEELGFLPGNMKDKMQPWLVPIFDSFKEYVSIQRLNEYIANEEIEICPVAFIRGRTFKDAWVLVDEAQNTTVNQMKTLLTRVGENCKLVVSGDLDQTDIKGTNGLSDFLNRYRLHGQEHEKNSNIQHIVFDDDDIMRSELVKQVLDIYKY